LPLDELSVADGRDQRRWGPGGPARRSASLAGGVVASSAATGSPCSDGATRRPSCPGPWTLPSNQPFIDMI
jgi:hypothetical protein